MVRVLTPEQVAAVVATSVTGIPPGTTVAQWVAKSRQESSHDADAIGVINNNDVGLWQINVRANRDLIPEASVSLDNAKSVLKSPSRNFNTAVAIFNRQGWQAWQASGGEPSPNAEDRRGAANPDLAWAQQNQIGGDPGGVHEGFGPLNPIDDITDFLGNIVDPIVAAAQWLGNPANWLRVLQVVGGIGITFVAAALLAKPIVQDVKRTVA